MTEEKWEERTSPEKVNKHRFELSMCFVKIVESCWIVLRYGKYIAEKVYEDEKDEGSNPLGGVSAFVQ